MERLASLGIQFSQNVLGDERDWAMLLEEEDLTGCRAGWPPPLPRRRASAGARGMSSRSSRSLIVPFLTFSPRRDLREKAMTAWLAHGANEGIRTTGRSSPRFCSSAPSERGFLALKLRRLQARDRDGENAESGPRDPEPLYVAFHGRLPGVEVLRRKRGAAA